MQKSYGRNRFVNFIAMCKCNFTLLCLFFGVLLHAQSLNCDSFCVVSIVYDSVPGYLNVTIANNDTNFINYPIVQLIDANGDTVANEQKKFDFFGHLDHSEQTYRITTTLSSFPSNWNGIVRLED